MSAVVVDASTSLAWCFPDEKSDHADRVLVSLKGKHILVPAVWGLEIANAILVGERKRRLSQPEIRRFIMFLESLSLVQDVRQPREYLNEVLPLAHAHGLSAYDACYLELSIRNAAPLATLDSKLQSAAKRAGVHLFTGEQV